jgi:hypothetical protein
MEFMCKVLIRDLFKIKPSKKNCSHLAILRMSSCKQFAFKLNWKVFEYVEMFTIAYFIGWMFCFDCAMLIVKNL